MAKCKSHQARRVPWPIRLVGWYAHRKAPAQRHKVIGAEPSSPSHQRDTVDTLQSRVIFGQRHAEFCEQEQQEHRALHKIARTPR